VRNTHLQEFFRRLKSRNINAMLTARLNSLRKKSFLSESHDLSG
jgi:hypothetical protein